LPASTLGWFAQVIALCAGMVAPYALLSMRRSLLGLDVPGAGTAR
jgi:hypothetical protein